MSENDQLTDREILLLTIGQIAPGMTTAKDIYSAQGQLILAKENQLDSNKIARLMFYKVTTVYVYGEEQSKQRSDSYYEKIKNSPDYMQFYAGYIEVLQELKHEMTQVVNHEQRINEAKLVQSLKKISEHGKGRYHLFEMMYCVHEQDNMTFVHSMNVALICNVFGHWLQMSEEDINVLTLCGLMHDVGKIAISREIIDKPTHLTNQEFLEIKQHTIYGYQMLLRHDIDPRIRLAALQHHERYDGSGYPLGKLGTEIHTFSMITAIADVFDAMTSNRVYRGAICPFSVLEMFENEGKMEYDLTLVIPLIERIAEIYINHTVRLSNQVQGEVILLNRHSLSRPVVRVGDEFIDLSKQSELKIEAVV